MGGWVGGGGGWVGGGIGIAIQIGFIHPSPAKFFLSDFDHYNTSVVTSQMDLQSNQNLQINLKHTGMTEYYRKSVLQLLRRT